MNTTSIPRLAISTALCSVLLLAACDNSGESRTAGQKLDAAVAKTEKNLEGLKAEAKVAGQEAKETASRLGEKIEVTARDAAITAGVKTELAKDAGLNALKIDVDTAGGMVTLKGAAPDAAAVERATAIAKKVDGVVSVDNRLVVQTSS